MVLCFFAQSNVFAQCTPDPNGPVTAGIYPGDSLPDGAIGQAYNQVIQIVLPRDTTVDVFGTPFSASFCSFSVQLTNLPAGLTAQCDDPSCDWAVDHTPGVISRGCILISGTPTDTVANDTLVASVTITPGLIDSMRNNACNTDSLRQQAGLLWPTIQALLTQPASIGLHIDNAVSIEQELRAELNLAIAPNPASDEAFITYDLLESRSVSIDLYDMVGRKIRQIQSNSRLIGNQTVQLPTSSLPSGLYFIRLNINQGEAIISEKLHIIR